MLDFLHQLFSWVCGQNLAHTWSPGGELLPCCQRCPGVYVGAFVAALLHLARPPQPTSFWRWLNGAFLLFMVPSGYHWIPQNPELRAVSGILFGFGLVAFLWLPLPGQFTIFDFRFSTTKHERSVNRKSQIVNAAALRSEFFSASASSPFCGCLCRDNLRFSIFDFRPRNTSGA